MFRLILAFVGIISAVAVCQADFDSQMRPLLEQYCSDCHSGSDANGEVDFESLGRDAKSVESAFEIWESVAGHLSARTMPPDDSPQPTDQERRRALEWYQSFVDSIPSRPSILRPRRLSAIEYRNTLHSLLGFDLEYAVVEAEQTDTETSLVMKLLPTDPPGRSGFTNDTNTNPLTTTAWDQYVYLVDVALSSLFSKERQRELEVYTGRIHEEVGLTKTQAEQMLDRFVSRAYRRPVSEVDLAKMRQSIEAAEPAQVVPALMTELKAALMSPAFLYRGFLVEGDRGERQVVDAYEMAERLSYFLWADMPDDQLFAAARSGELLDNEAVIREVDRMLTSEKARSLASVFVEQWFSLSEIDLASNNPPVRDALKSQPIDFMQFLFANDRPLLEMIDSKVAFINPHTARMYGRDAKQMAKYVKQKGIETEKVPNQRIELRHATERGGILTMPGILAMNRGPILRGTWILERVLGEHLPDPPANVGQVAGNKPGQTLTFRQRFEAHRANQACAVCHDKIDPLGFAMQAFDNGGQFLFAENYRLKGKKKPKQEEDLNRLDTSGVLPTGEQFKDATELKQILTGGQKQAVVRNIVQRTMAYALCRKLELFDQPTVETITQQMLDSEGTWRDLFHAVATSVPMRETILSEAGN